MRDWKAEAVANAKAETEKPAAPAVSAGMMTAADAELAAGLAASAFTVRVKPGLKKPVGLTWNQQPGLTPDAAREHVAEGGNVGVDPGRSRLVFMDAENAEGVEWLLSMGFTLTVIPAKSGAGAVLATGEANEKEHGGHVWLRVPNGAPEELGDTRSMIHLSNGGRLEIFASCGKRQVVAPPSRLDEAYGRSYAYTGADIAEAPAWLWDRTVPVPEAMDEYDAAQVHGAVAPPTPRERAERSVESQALSDAIVAIPWSEWIAGDPRIELLDTVGSCGCNHFHYTEQSSDTAGFLHACDEHDGKAHVFSTTAMAELGLEWAHVSRLDFALGLRNSEAGREKPLTRADLMREFDLIVAVERELPQSTRPADFVAIADYLDRLGQTERALRFKASAAEMQAEREARAERQDGGETFLSEPMIGTETAGTNAGAATEEQVPIIVVPLSTGTVPPAFGGPAAVAPRPHTGAGPFPVHALPKVLRDFAVAVAASMAVPVELVAPMQIAVLAAGCGPANIYVTDGWEAEPGAVWIMIVSPPSTRKTPVLKVVKAPMTEAVRIINLALGEQRAELQMEADALAEAAEEAENDAKVAMKAAAKELVDDPDAAARAASAAAKATANGTWVPPTAKGLATDLAAKAAMLKKMAEEAQAAVPPEVEPTFTDATPEAMMELLARQKGRGFLIHPEASEILTSATRTDTKGMETAKFCSTYDEEYISTHRITRSVTEIDRPSLCSLLIVQPDPVKEAYAPRQGGGKSKITTNGWSDRQGFVLVPESEEDTLRRDRSIDPVATKAYMEAVTAEWVRTYMLSATDREAWANLRFRLTPEAFEVIADHYDLVERIKRQPGTRAESWGKVIGRAVRIARCFAQLDVVNLGSEVHPIEAHHMQAGWEIAHWMMRSFDAATNAPETVTIVELVEQAADYVLEKVPAVGDMILRPKVRSSKRHGPYVEAALEQLTRRGQVEVRGQEIHRVALAAAA
ncbi:DUF3987 domain-containing protein [Mycobacteroides chelonae]|uniref:DUF3987 domain-containing protein n=1 Tax=Mycobacteroides chelonae TaxID=1774 RepID=UPI0013F4F929|nr:DUF3987 domain-containing protein [Mycobacteroides chelonae]